MSQPPLKALNDKAESTCLVHPKELLTLLLTRVGCRYSDSCLRPMSDDLAPAQLMPDTPHIEGVYTPRRAAQLIVEDGYDLTMRRDLVVPYCNLKSCMPVSSKRQIAFRYIETPRRGNRYPPPRHPAQTGVRHT